jgi:O-antigen/teichoic acid export membrane protein
MLLVTGNLAFNLFGLVTGPVLARALGPAGRGTLAAILVPLFIASWVAALGLPAFARRSAAREGRPRALVATLGVIAVASGLIAFLAAPAVASTLAEGRDVVHDLLLAGFALLPLFVAANVLVSVLAGLEQWRLYLAAQLLPPVATLIGLIALWAVGQLTVTTAAITSLGGLLLVFLPAGFALRGAGAFRFELPLARRALAFGIRAWPGQLGSLANARLDQLLMIPLVDPADLGFYVVAWTVATGPAVLGRAFAWAVGPRVARGDTRIVLTACRILMPAVVISSALLAAVTPVLLPLVFGHDFEQSVGLAWILLCASVPWQGAILLGEALSASGRPGLFTIGQMTALAVTVAGLLALLPVLGVYGAAFTSLAAYLTQFGFVLWAARRHFAESYLDLLVPRRADLRTVSNVFLRRSRRDHAMDAVASGRRDQ